MNKNKVFTVLIILVSLLLSCLITSVKYKKPAELDIPQRIKTIAVLSTGEYRYRQDIYEVMMSIFSSESVKERYDLIDRENINKILMEQNLYNTDDFDDSTAVKLGNLSGAQAIILCGFKNVEESIMNSKVVIKRKYKQEDKIKYKNVELSSLVKTYSFNLFIRMIDIENGTVLYNYFNRYELKLEKYYDNKPDEYVSLEEYSVNSYDRVLRNKDFWSYEGILQSTAKKYGEAFAKKIAPYMTEDLIMFELISQDDINKKLFKYIQSSLFEEALQLMIDNLDYIKSIVKPVIRAKHFYNMGAIYEILNDYENAKKYYEMAIKDDSKQKYLDALKSIKDKIKEKEKLKEQLKGKNDNKDKDW